MVTRWVGVVSLVFVFVAVEIGDTKLLIWATFIAVIISFLMEIPVLISVAVTNEAVVVQGTRAILQFC